MQIEPAPDLRASMVQALRDEYLNDRSGDGFHQSELAHCLTKSYRDRLEPMPPTDHEIKLFAIGFGMERVILRHHEPAPEPFEVDGITLSLDSLGLLGMPLDIKTTRMRAAGRKGEDGFQLPEGWKRQFAAYRYGLNVQRVAAGLTPEYHFGVICYHLIEPEVTAWQVIYTHNELVEHWQWLLGRKATLGRLLADRVPEPFQHNDGQSPDSWECKGCCHSLTCQLEASLESLSKEEVTQ